MVKTYRNIQQWDHWLTQFLGATVLAAEQEVMPRFLEQIYGKRALLIGVPRQYVLLESSMIVEQVALSPLTDRRNRIRCVETKFYELPIATSSIDLVLLPHTLEYTEAPEKLLAEACRIVKPEGHIIILGFNPLSFWGATKWLTKSDRVPWSFHFFTTSVVKKWLTAANFELVKQEELLFRPPLKNHAFYNKIKFMEWVGNKCFKPFGGIYGLVAKAKVIPLTPLKLQWKQKMPAVQVTIPRPSMREWL